MTTETVPIYTLTATVHGCRFQIRLNGGVLMSGDGMGGDLHRVVNHWILPGRNELAIQVERAADYGDQPGNYTVQISSCDRNDAEMKQLPLASLSSASLDRARSVSFDVPTWFPAPLWTLSAELPRAVNSDGLAYPAEQFAFLSKCVEQGRQDLYLKLSERRNRELAEAYFQSYAERVAQTAKETRSLFSGAYRPIPNRSEDLVCESLSGNRLLRVCNRQGGHPWLRFQHIEKPIVAKLDTYWCWHSGYWVWLR